MKKIPVESIEHMFLINHEPQKDARGQFQDCYVSTLIQELLPMQVNISITNRNVIRGFDLANYYRIITCLAGRAFHAVIDLRKDSSTYRNIFTILLNKPELSLLIPEGCANGFYSYNNQTSHIYIQGDEWDEKRDQIIHWKSYDVNWPKSKKYILSEKDQHARKMTL